MSEQLKSGTLKDAEAAQRLFIDQGGKSDDVKGPFHQWWAFRALGVLEKIHRKGDRYALAFAIRVCAAYSVQLPAWITRAYCRRFDDIHMFREGSWEHLFGRALPKGRHRTALDNIWKKGHLIRFDAMMNKEQFGAALYERIANDRNMNTTSVKEYAAAAADLPPKVLAAFDNYVPPLFPWWFVYFLRRAPIRKSRKKQRKNPVGTSRKKTT